MKTFEIFDILDLIRSETKRLKHQRVSGLNLCENFASLHKTLFQLNLYFTVTGSINANRINWNNLLFGQLILWLLE